MMLESKRVEFLRDRTKKIKEGMEKTTENSPQDQFIGQMNVKCSQNQNLRLNAQVRSFNLAMDEPPSIAGDNTAPNPVEFLIMAYAGCLEMNWIMYSSLYNLNVSKVEVEIQATIDRRYALGNVEQFPARLQSLKIISHLETTESQQKVERVFRKVKEICPVGGSLHPDIKKEYILDLIIPKNAI